MPCVLNSIAITAAKPVSVASSQRKVRELYSKAQLYICSLEMTC
jgi:hypothetical protein